MVDEAFSKIVPFMR